MKSEKIPSIVNGFKRTIITTLTAGLLLAFLTPVFGHELKLKGEAKSGIYWEQYQEPGDEPKSSVKFHNKDDAGNDQGRFQLDLDYDNGNGLGMRARIRWENWLTSPAPNMWQYAFAYGNFFNDQLTLSIGKLGSSPWGTGGPEMWQELEISGRSGGIRIEVKPAILSGLNVGFVLNGFNMYADLIPQERKDKISLLDILMESVIGISYTHDYFHVRFAYRLDSDQDCARDLDPDNEKEAGSEGELLYRIEERALKNFVPGLKMWAMGYFQGVGSEKEDYALFKNWLFVEYAPDLFTAQVRIGYDWQPIRNTFYVKPSFYWNFFDRLLTVGASFQYAQDSGDGKLFEGSPFYFIELEPKIQLNFSSAFIAFVYNWRREYKHMNTSMEDKGITEPIKQTQWINVRFGIYF